MTQILQSPYAVPVLQIIAGVAVLQIFTGAQSPLGDYLARKVSDLTDEVFIAGKNVIHDFPVIAISAAVTYAVQLLDQRFVVTRYPAWSMGSLGETPLKVTFYVAGILAVRSALSTYLQRVLNRREEGEGRDTDKNVKHARQAMVRNIVPLAIGCTAAYFAGVPVKLAQTALFTAALIPVVKLLGNGFEYLISVGVVKNSFEKVYGWMK